MEEDAFSEFYKMYYKYVYRCLYSLTFSQQKAEDLTQDVFVKAFCVLDPEKAGIKSWLLTVAHNLYVDYIKKNRRMEYQGDEALARYPDRDMHQAMAEREAVSGVMEQLKRLPEAQRQAVILCLVNELSYEETAGIMGISVSAVTNLIYRARKTLRTCRRAEE